MRQPPSFSPRRPFARRSAVPRSGVEAAAALLSTEFERQRHRRERARLLRHLSRAEAALMEHDLRAARLCAAILGPDGSEDGA